MRVRIRRFRSGDPGCPRPHGVIRRPHPRHPMLPSGTTRIGDLARSGVIGSDGLSVVGCQPTSSALCQIETSGVFVSTGGVPPPARCWLLWPLLTSHGISSVGSPQVRTQFSPAQPPHLPPQRNQTASLGWARSASSGHPECNRRVPARLVASVPQPRDSYSSARGSCLVFLQRVGYPALLDFG